MAEAFEWVQRNLGTVWSLDDIERSIQSPMTVFDGGGSRIICHFEEIGVVILLQQGNRVVGGHFYLKPNVNFAPYKGQLIASLMVNDSAEQVSSKLRQRLFGG